MAISSAQYQRNRENTDNIAIEAIIDGIKWSVPLDPANTDYQAIQEWVAKGNKIEEAD
tara:strand:- start:147 stop:320 length:174 start_codon:yes stop_codon:yes gene_type:complete